MVKLHLVTLGALSVLFLTSGCETPAPQTEEPPQSPTVEQTPVNDEAPTETPPTPPPSASETLFTDKPAETPPPPTEPYEIGGDVLRPQRVTGSRSTKLTHLMRVERYVWGSCILRGIVTREGRLDDLELLKPVEVAPEVEAALHETFDQWRFEPATLHGKPVAVRYHLVIHHCPHRPQDRDVTQQ